MRTSSYVLLGCGFGFMYAAMRCIYEANVGGQMLGVGAAVLVFCVVIHDVITQGNRP